MQTAEAATPLRDIPCRKRRARKTTPRRRLGGEGAGVVEDIGTGVTEVKPGDRVAYTGGPLGAYSEARLIPAERLVVLPKGISDQQAAAMMLKGLTAQYLIRQTYRVKGGDTILFGSSIPTALGHYRKVEDEAVPAAKRY